MENVPNSALSWSLIGVALILSTMIGREVESLPSLAYTDKTDCAEIRATLPGYRFASGLYHIQVGGARRPVQVYCDLTTNGGDWTVIQRRIDGTVNFYKNWAEYAAGFGDPSAEYWIGLDNLHSLTIRKRYVLRIELTDCDEVTRYAQYDNFVVADEGCNYTLTSAGAFCGTAGDSLAIHVGSSFTTYDKDNNVWAPANCAVLYDGAWWYKNCHDSNLNGAYKVPCVHTTYADGINWETWKGNYYSYKHAVMKIRPFNQ